MAPQTNQALKEARRFVRAVQQSGIDLDAAYLYGSFAHGTPHAWSDIDVALVSKDLTGGFEDLEKISPAIHTTDSRIENVRFHPRDFQDENPLVWEIKTTGIPLTRATRLKSNVRPINTRRVVSYWHKAARQEWRKVESFFANKHYSYALAFARRYLEAALKAVIVQRTGAHAPVRHSLSDFAKSAQLNLTPPQQALLVRADSYRRETFEHPDAAAIRRAHTRRFTSTELDAIKELGDTVLALRPKRSAAKAIRPPKPFARTQKANL